MCNTAAAHSSQPDSTRNNQRLKLWELDSRWMCSILGTCLTMAELHKAKRQANLLFERPPSDYHLHATLVNEANEQNHLSRCLQKILDKKYQRWIKQWAKYKTREEFESAWCQAKQSGDIAGNFWALLTHPSCHIELIREANGDVHMLSHLQSASNRADIKRLEKQSKKITDLKQKLSQLRQKAREKVTGFEAQLRQQAQRLEDKNRALAQLQHKLNEVHQYKPINKEQKSLIKQLVWTEQRLGQKELEQFELKQQNQALKEQVKELLPLITPTAVEPPAPPENTPALDQLLNGKQILYIGGRSSLLPHLRQLVEKQRGQFNHHDGGKENGVTELNCELARADMVFCPIDCISHDACLRAKHHCKKYAKPFFPLRSSSLSSFDQQLNTRPIATH